MTVLPQRVAAVHCGPRERAELLTRLLAEAETSSGGRRVSIRLLAASYRLDAADLLKLRRMSVGSLMLWHSSVEHLFPELVAILGDIDGLRELAMLAPDPAGTSSAGVMPGPVDLVLAEVADGYRLSWITDVFPSLRRLQLIPDALRCTEIDLRPLADLPGLAVTVNGAGLGDIAVSGAELFSADRLRVTR